MKVSLSRVAVTVFVTVSRDRVVVGVVPWARVRPDVRRLREGGIVDGTESGHQQPPRGQVDWRGGRFGALFGNRRCSHRVRGARWRLWGRLVVGGRSICTDRGLPRIPALEGDQRGREHLGGVLNDISDRLALEPPQLACQGLGETSLGDGGGNRVVEILGRRRRSQVENG
jgi:hypothetical protein